MKAAEGWGIEPAKERRETAGHTMLRRGSPKSSGEDGRRREGVGGCRRREYGEGELSWRESVQEKGELHAGLGRLFGEGKHMKPCEGRAGIAGGTNGQEAKAVCLRWERGMG